jgi:hypothetical protein
MFCRHRGREISATALDYRGLDSIDVGESCRIHLHRAARLDEGDSTPRAPLCTMDNVLFSASIQVSRADDSKAAQYTWTLCLC